MSVCPLCYGELKYSSLSFGLVKIECDDCALETSVSELTKLKADTYDSIISHLLESGKDARRREQARCKIALKNIKRWALGNIKG